MADNNNRGVSGAAACLDSFTNEPGADAVPLQRRQDGHWRQRGHLDFDGSDRGDARRAECDVTDNALVLVYRDQRDSEQAIAAQIFNESSLSATPEGNAVYVDYRRVVTLGFQSNQHRADYR